MQGVTTSNNKRPTAGDKGKINQTKKSHRN